MHMPTVPGPTPVAGASAGLPVEYIATGIEGLSFLVPIGQVVNNDTYKVVYAPQGVQNVPFVDLPTAGGALDRSTTFFRVNVVAALAAGEKLVFVLFGA